jgi:hypothetical protein
MVPQKSLEISAQVKVQLRPGAKRNGKIIMRPAVWPSAASARNGPATARKSGGGPSPV